MKKFTLKTFLVAALAMLAGNSWADTQTIFSMTVNTQSTAVAYATENEELNLSSYATITGGSAIFASTAARGESYPVIDANANYIRLTKSSGNYNGYIKITLDNSNALALGDVITYKDASDNVITKNMVTSTSSSRDNSENTAGSFTVASTNTPSLVGATTIYLLGSSSSTANIHSVAITRCVRGTEQHLTESYPFYTWASESEATFTSSPGDEVTASAPSSVVGSQNLKKETATFAGHDISNRFAYSDGKATATLEANKGLNVATKGNKNVIVLSILNLKVGNQVIVDLTGSSGVWVVSNNATFKDNDEGVRTLTDKGKDNSNLIYDPASNNMIAKNTNGLNNSNRRIFTMTSDGTLDLYTSTSTETYSTTIANVEIISGATTLPAGANGYTTYSHSTDNYTVSGANAYYAPNTVSDSKVVLSKITEGQVIPANQGVILKADNEGDVITINLTSDDATELTNNKLVAVSSDTETPSGSYNYVLATKGGSTQFVSFTNDQWQSSLKTALVGKCYLALDSAPSAKSLTISFEDDVTGISNATTNNNVANGVKKYIENGRLVINKNGKMYNAAGALLK